MPERPRVSVPHELPERPGRTRRRLREEPLKKTGIRAQRRDETRRKLFESALEVFRRDGVSAAKIEDITALAGTSRGSFYFHFPTKEDVLAELLSISVTRVGAKVDLVSVDAPIGDTMEAVAKAIAEEWKDDARLFPDVGAVALRKTEFDPDSRAHHAVRRPLVERLEKAQARGEVMAEIEAGLLGDLFLVNQFAVAIAWTANPVVPLEMALIGTAQLFLRGAGRREPTPEPPPKSP